MGEKHDLQEEVLEGLGSLLERVPETSRPVLLDRITRLIEAERVRERQKYVAACRARAELWRTTLAAKSRLPAAQEEARSRANEAEYLADLLDTQQ